MNEARERLVYELDEVNYPGEQKTTETFVEWLEAHRDLVLAALGGKLERVGYSPKDGAFDGWSFPVVG